MPAPINIPRMMDDDEHAAKLFVAVLNKYLPGRVIEINTDDLDALSAKYAPDVPILVLDFQDPKVIGISVSPKGEVSNG